VKLQLWWYVTEYNGLGWVGLRKLDPRPCLVQPMISTCLAPVVRKCVVLVSVDFRQKNYMLKSALAATSDVTDVPVRDSCSTVV